MSGIRFYSHEQLGPRQSLTPEGFLLCEDVPLARIGTLLYAHGEIPIDGTRDGIIRVERHPEDVFADNAVLSFHGKPVTDDHPPSKVTPDCWREYTVGTVINPRRGDGYEFDSSFLYADLLIQHAPAIRAIRDGKREVSAGYDAEYLQLAPGVGRQFNIIGNHVALVDKGRCGHHCSIGDRAMPKLRTFRDRVMTAFRTRDQEALVEELDKVDEMLGEPVSGEDIIKDADRRDDDDDDKKTDDRVTVNLRGMHKTQDDDEGEGNSGGLAELEARIDALEEAFLELHHSSHAEEGAMAESPGDAASVDTDTVEELKVPELPPVPQGTSDSPAKGVAGTKDTRARVMTRDSAHLQGLFSDAISRAELLLPGIAYPTFDAKSPAPATVETLCSFRRNVLEQAWKTEPGKKLIQPFAASDKGVSFRKMTCDEAAQIFNGASELARRTNNTFVGNARTQPQGGMTKSFAGRAPTAAELNERHRALFPVHGNS